MSDIWVWCESPLFAWSWTSSVSGEAQIVSQSFSHLVNQSRFLCGAVGGLRQPAT